MTYLQSAFFASSLLALLTGPLGCFVVWRGLAFLGETLSHGALLGIVLATFFALPPSIGIFLFSSLLILLLVMWEKDTSLAQDTRLAVFGHAAIALGLVALSLTKGLRIQYSALLWGDLLSVSSWDLVTLLGSVVVVWTFLSVYKQPLLLLIIHEELAFSQGVPVRSLKTALLFLIALCVAVAIKLVGALLVTSLLVIPQAAVRTFSKTPTQMMIFATLYSLAAVFLGLTLSLTYDIPPAPSIVSLAFGGYFLGFLNQSLRR